MRAVITGHTVPATSPGRPLTEAPEARRPIGLHWFLPDGGYRFTPLGPRSLVVGRDPSAEVHLPFAEISRRHAEIAAEGPIFIVRDLGSRNGIALNGQPATEGLLSPGGLLRVGECLAVVGSGVPAPETSARPGEYLVGPALALVLEPAFTAAQSDLPIVIEGDTGTGKEAVARLIHARSGRPGKFLGINCAALPESLAEAELFGFAKGSFTGAERARAGHLREADRGTLLLDEITDLPMPIQAKLLRVLEQREVMPLGESSPISIDVRIVAATQEPLEQAVADKRFRADLEARLRGLTVSLPPLRERREEVPLFFHAFLHAFLAQASIPRPAVSVRLLEQLCLHSWPGNVRELSLLVRRLATLHANEPLWTRVHLASALSPASPSGSGTPAEVTDAAVVARAVEDCQGNLTRAAERLGISRGKAYRLLKTLDPALPDPRDPK
jgi:DNA-binding NtrC family response regulator